MNFLDGVFHYLTTASNWSGSDGFGNRLLLQVELAGIVIVAASIVGISLGFYLGHVRKGAFIAVNAANAARAIPSVALLTLLVIVPEIAFTFDGFLAAALALFVLAIPPIVTNSYIGMREVDSDVREAARATGMTGVQSFFRVEVPLALPFAIAGMRTAAVEVVATSTLAAYVTFNDLGEYIFAGLAVQNNVETFSGALLVALLAGAVDLVLVGIYRTLTPQVIRRDLGRRASRELAPTLSMRAAARIRASANTTVDA